MRALIRLVLVVIVLVLAAFFLLGYRPGTFMNTSAPASAPVIDTERARERGAELGEKGAIAATRLRDGVAEASITGKIKAKMALDDTIQARSIDVTTEGATVTLTGSVRTAAERTRAVNLARETEGVTNVVDRLQVK
jgi:hyperosmotically inducible protein